MARQDTFCADWVLVLTGCWCRRCACADWDGVLVIAPCACSWFILHLRFVGVR
jgi:hypothetical protein